MKTISRRRPWMAFLVLVVLGTWEVTWAVKNSSECEEEKRALVQECSPVVTGSPPSRSCCIRIRVTRLECVCPLVTPALAAQIGVDRALRVVHACGREVPRHFKCGSIITP